MVDSYMQSLAESIVKDITKNDEYNFLKTGKKSVLLLATGSVATLKLCKIYHKLSKKCDVRIAVTNVAKNFMSDYLLSMCYDDSDNFKCWKKLGDKVLHVELCKWADCVVICPLDACTLGKIASGVCDNLITEIIRAYPLKKPLIFCLAMNIHMYQHPITMQQVKVLKSWGYIEIEPTEKLLACGDYGIGGMCSPKQIVKTVYSTLNNDK